MNINKHSLTISAARPSQYPDSDFIELAFAGRSNVGKSSLINRLLNRKNFARTSSKPGKTRVINFYNIDDLVHFVDLPGYGYAKVSKDEKERWGFLMEDYLNNRPQLVQTVLVVDSRHKPTADDVLMAKFIRAVFGTVFVVANKADKLSKKQLGENLRLIFDTLSLCDNDFLIPFSAETGEGRQEVFDTIMMLISDEEQ